MKSKNIIFTDGSSRGNPGPGGWGAIISMGDLVLELGGREDKTTNNRMELTAVIKSLLHLKKLQPTTSNLEPVVYSDSSYVINGASKWIFGWKANNWKTATKQPVLNQDLWEEMYEILQELKVKFCLIEGHAGVPANERCDVIATSFADNEKIDLFSGESRKYGIDLNILSNPRALDGVKKKSSGNTGKAYSYVSSVLGKIEIHKTWNECERRVKGAKGARFRKALSKDDEARLIEEWSK